MEVAGLVLGAVPIAVQALTLYKDGRELHSVFRNKRRHVETLIRSLNGYQAELKINLGWLLRQLDAWKPEYTTEELATLLEDPELVEDLRFFLGVEIGRGFQDALRESHDAILQVVKGIKGLIPETNSPLGPDLHTLLESQKQQQRNDKWKVNGVKLALNREGIDQAIRQLDRANRTVAGIRSAASDIQQMESTTAPSHASRRLFKSLARVQEPACRLWRAIRQSWTPGCHPEHQAKLFLDNRITSVPQKRFTSSPIEFKIIFIAGTNGNAWQECQIDVRDQEDSGDPLQEWKGKTVTISVSSQQPAKPPVLNMCKLISDSPTDSVLQFSVHSALHPEPCTLTRVCRSANTINLAYLISASDNNTDSRSAKMGLRPRLLLALTLSSAFFQLHLSPWFGTSWTKDHIYFLAPSAGHADMRPSEVDISQPLISETFIDPTVAVATNSQLAKSAPRQALLELGIMLLELWLEKSFESYFAHDTRIQDPTQPDYFTKAALAQRWLEEEGNNILPQYSDAVARCIRCHFDGVSMSPSWDEKALKKGILQGVVEPLYAICHPRPI